MNSHDFLIRLKPGVPAAWLFTLAGGLWFAVGSMLCAYASLWIVAMKPEWKALDILVGVACAFVAYRAGFSVIARRNILRISAYSGKTCVFAFQAWRSYLIVIFMIALGMILRHSALPRVYLAAVYLTIGGALFLSSFQYYRQVRSIRGR